MTEWSRDNEILALWLYKCFCGKGHIQHDKQKYIKTAADISGLKSGSLRMKLSNIAFLEREICGKISSGFTVLASASKLNRVVFQEFFYNKTELCCKADAIISAAPSDYFLQKNILKRLLTE